MVYDRQIVSLKIVKKNRFSGFGKSEFNPLLRTLCSKITGYNVMLELLYNRMPGGHWQFNTRDEWRDAAGNLVYSVQGGTCSEAGRVPQSHGVSPQGQTWAGDHADEACRPDDGAVHCQRTNFCLRRRHGFSGLQAPPLSSRPFCLNNLLYHLIVVCSDGLHVEMQQ